MEGRFSARGSASQAEVDTPGGGIRRILLVDSWEPGAPSRSLQARLAHTRWRVDRVCPPTRDVLDTVLELAPDIVLLTADAVDVSVMALTEAITSKGRVPVAWLVRDPSVAPWSTSPLWVLGASESAEALVERLDHVVVPPPVPSQDPSPVVQAMLDSISVGIVAVCPNHGVVSANKTMLAFLGLTQEELERVGLGGITHPDDAVIQIEKLRDLITGAASSVDLEKRYVARDGTTVWGRTSMKLALVGPERRPLLFVTAQNWEQQRATRLSLVQSETRFRQAVAAMPVVFWALTPDWGTVAYISPSFERVFGYSCEALNEDPGLWLRAIHPEDRDRIIRHLTAHHGEPGEVEYRIVRADGEVRWIRDVMSPIFDADGRLDLVSGFGEDVTAIKDDALMRARMEEKVRQAEKLESLGLLAGGFAHDFNNMLLGIRGYAELALARVGGDAAAAAHLQRVLDASRRASEMCENLLAHTGSGALDKQPVDLASVVDEVVTMMSVAVHRDTTVRFDAAPDIPSIRAHATQVRQMVMNLVLNASDALGGRPGVVRVSISEGRFDAEQLRSCVYAERCEAMAGVLLTVADTGEGIPPAALERVFEPFFTTKPEGRGLGLASVRRIVKRHGGAVCVQSTVGKGTVFQVLFPVG